MATTVRVRTRKKAPRLYARVTVEAVRARVEQIRAVSEQPDAELAHSEEDALYEEVLRAVAGGHPDAAALARAALETKKLKFDRWCA